MGSGSRSAVLDTSAAVAVIVGDAGRERMIERLEAGGPFYIAAPTLVELRLVLAGRFGRDANADIARFRTEIGLTVIPFGEFHAVAAFEAWSRYGKGRHPASLNLGDCMAYAAAKVAQAELIYVGDDFAQTDLA